MVILYIGRTFEILTDRRPLVWLFNLKEPNSKLLIRPLKLEEFHYAIKYKPGKNDIADPISRINLNTLETQSNLNNPGNIGLNIREFLGEFNPDNIDPVEFNNTLKELEINNLQPPVNNLEIIQKKY